MRPDGTVQQYCLLLEDLPVQYGFFLLQNNGIALLDEYPERSFQRFVSLSSLFPLQVNVELKLSLRQSGYSVQLGLTGYTGLADLKNRHAFLYRIG